MLCLILCEYKAQAQSRKERQVTQTPLLSMGWVQAGHSGKTEQKHIKKELLTN